MTIDLPITTIEGIGPATAERLEAVDVERVGDLFFVSDAEVHRVCADVASLDEAASWRQMAALMEVEGIDAQRAEALVSGGIETVEELAGKRLSALLEIFQAAIDSGRLAALPETDDAARMLAAATRIEMGAVAMGTLVDGDGSPVAGATLRAGWRTALSDAGGRFRLAGIDPGLNPGLRIERDGAAPQWIETTFIYDTRLVGGPTVVLPADAPSGLDEFEGDALPPFEGFPVRIVRFESDAPREGEVLRVQGFYASADDVRMASIYRAFEAGEVIVRKARLPVSGFVGDPPLMGEIYLYSEGRLRRAAGGAGAVELHRAGRRAKRTLEEAGADDTSMDPASAITALGQALRDASVLPAASTESNS